MPLTCDYDDGKRRNPQNWRLAPAHNQYPVERNLDAKAKGACLDSHAMWHKPIVP